MLTFNNFDKRKLSAKQAFFIRLIYLRECFDLGHIKNLVIWKIYDRISFKNEFKQMFSRYFKKDSFMLLSIYRFFFKMLNMKIVDWMLISYRQKNKKKIISYKRAKVNAKINKTEGFVRKI